MSDRPFNWNDLITDAYLITLEGDLERQKFAHDQCRKVDLDYKIFLGSPGHKMDEMMFKHLGMDIPHAGSAACGASHIRLWKYILDNYKDGDKILVIEDDIIFYENFKTVFPLVWKEVPADMEVLYIGHCCFDSASGKYVEKGHPKTTHCYIITPAGCKKYLSVLPCTQNIDNHLSTCYYNGSLKINSYACLHRGHTSPKQHGALGVYFRGFAYQEQADIPLSIHRKYEPLQYKYTTSIDRKILSQTLYPYHLKAGLKILVIGDKDGRITRWFLDNLCDSSGIIHISGSQDELLLDNLTDVLGKRVKHVDKTDDRYDIIYSHGIKRDRSSCEIFLLYLDGCLNTFRFN